MIEAAKGSRRNLRRIAEVIMWRGRLKMGDEKGSVDRPLMLVEHKVHLAPAVRALSLQQAGVIESELEPSGFVVSTSPLKEVLAGTGDQTAISPVGSVRCINTQVGIQASLQNDLLSVAWVANTMDRRYPGFDTLLGFTEMCGAALSRATGTPLNPNIVQVRYTNHFEKAFNEAGAFFAGLLDRAYVPPFLGQVQALHELSIRWAGEAGVDRAITIQSAELTGPWEQPKPGFAMTLISGVLADTSSDFVAELRRCHEDVRLLYDELVDGRDPGACGG